MAGDKYSLEGEPIPPITMLKNIIRSSKEAPAWKRYSFAAGLSLAILAITILLVSFLGRTVYIFAFIAVTLSSAYGGFGPGLVSTLISVFGADYFLIPPTPEIQFARHDILSTGLFGLVAVIVSGLAARQRQVQRNLLLITDSIPAGVAFIDSAMRYRFVNKVYFDRFGVTPDQAYGMPVKELVGPEVFQHIKPQIERALAGHTVEYENEILIKDGQRRTIQASIVPSRPKKGKIEGVYVLTTDITERKRAEDELRRHRQQLADLNQNLEEEIRVRLDQLRKKEEELNQVRKLEAVGQLAAGVAHEINNPLGVILGYVEAIEQDLQASDPLRAPMKEVIRETLRCKRLVQNLLAFSRERAPGIRLENPAAVVENALSLVDHQARLKSVTVVREFAGPIPEIAMDRSQMEQVVINLCTNAIDAMPGGGRLTVGLCHTDRWLEIRVADTGAGIPPDIQQKMFEPFFTTKGLGKGTGLGLSLVYESVKKHQGTIDVKSDMGKGSVFIVRLPLRSAPTEGATDD